MHLSGYHLEWNHSNPKVVTHQSKNRRTETGFSPIVNRESADLIKLCNHSVNRDLQKILPVERPNKLHKFSDPHNASAHNTRRYNVQKIYSDVAVSKEFNKTANPQTPDKRTDPLSVIAFISSIVGLILLIVVVGLLFMLIAFILAIISLNKITKHPDKWKGKGFNIAAIMIGFSTILLLIGVILYVIVTGDIY